MSAIIVIPQTGRTSPDPGYLNQRELIAYSFLAALGLLTALLLGMLVWYALPRPEYLLAGELFDFSPDPTPSPIFQEGLSLYLVNTGSELVAFDRHTPHHTRVLFEWAPMNHRFEDPLTGSRFALDGTWLLGPATRNLDRYPVTVEDGQIWIETSRLMPGRSHQDYFFCAYNPGQGELCWHQ